MKPPAHCTVTPGCQTAPRYQMQGGSPIQITAYACDKHYNDGYSLIRKHPTRNITLLPEPDTSQSSLFD